jgi:hypothetical protein
MSSASSDLRYDQILKNGTTTPAGGLRSGGHVYGSPDTHSALHTEHGQQHLMPDRSSAIWDWLPAVRRNSKPEYQECGGGQHSQNGNESTFRAWRWEILSLLFAISLMVAIIAVLAYQNGRPVKDWGMPISLNSLIAFFSTFYRGALVAIASEIISQEKWLWFWSASSATRPLLNLQHFENGSRGIWGSLRLVPIVAMHSISSLLAVMVIIVSFAIGPFVQQSIRTVESDTAIISGNASRPVTYAVNGSNTWFRTRKNGLYATWDLQHQARGAMFSSVANPGSNDSAIIPICPTGNCSFPSWGNTNTIGSLELDLSVTHATVGVCSSCTDVTSLGTVVNADSAITVSLPNGVSITNFDSTDLMAVNSTGDLSWAGQIIRSEAAARLRWAFVNTTILSFRLEKDQIGSSASYVAVSCSLYPCLRSYSGVVRNGRFTEMMIGSTPLYPDLGNYTGDDAESKAFYGPPMPTSELFFAAVQSPCRVGSNELNSSNSSQGTTVRLMSPENSPSYPSITAPESCIFRFHSFPRVLFELMYKNELFMGNCTGDNRQGGNLVCKDKFWLAQLWERGNATSQTISDRFSSFATAATNQLRLGLGRQEETPERVFGQAFQNVSYSVISWPWLLLPVILLVIQAVLLARMMIRTSFPAKDMAWKSNILPFLYYHDRFVGQDGRPLRQQDHPATATQIPLMTASQIEDMALGVNARFMRDSMQTSYETSSGTRSVWYKKAKRHEQASDVDSLWTPN